MGRISLGVALVLGGLPAAAASPPSARATLAPAAAHSPAGVCVALDGVREDPERVRLRATGSGQGAVGSMELLMSESPFGVTVSEEGRYQYEVTLTLERLRRRPGRVYVAWATTPDLDRVHKLGVVGDAMAVSARVEWTKFLVLVSEEASADVERWSGPILLTGLSPSALMHTMAGHGIFEGVDCTMVP